MQEEIPVNLWKWMGKVCSLTPGTKRLALQLFYWWKTHRYQKRYVDKCAPDPHTVVFEAYMGKRYACSPRALYEAMLADPEYDSWTKIWAFREPQQYRFLEKDPHTRVVSWRSADYYRSCAGAGYWITNSRMPRELTPRDNQSYIQCWHGTPLKKLGYDLEHYAEKNSTLSEVRENYLAEARRVTHMPSPSAFYTEKMISAFHLDALGKKEVLWEMGYPRNDRLFLTDREEHCRIRERLGIPQGKKVILYAPTWRENQHEAGAGYTYRNAADFSLWKEKLGEEWIVLFRAHYFIRNSLDLSGLGDFVRDVSGLDEINDLYLAADVLITDYSSVFFDFANLERPILFYMYDYHQYREEMRDFYFDTELLPGPVFQSQEALLDAFGQLEKIRRDYLEKYQKFNSIFNPHMRVCSGDYLKEWLR